jgi:hypothetical protein
MSLDQLYSDAYNAAEEAYAEIIAEPEFVDFAPHRARVCNWASYIIVKSLTQKGHTVFIGDYGTLLVPCHYYVTCELEDKQIKIEPTWQQFTPEHQHNEGAPKMLFGSTEEVVATATTYGVSESVAQIWQVKPHSIQKFCGVVPE